MSTTQQTAPLTVYWQPGCTSCLRTKEFLTRHGVPFVSVNVVADAQGFEALARLGLRQVPIVARGDDWVNGQVIKDVARIAGISLDTQRMLAPAELATRIGIMLGAARRAFVQLPELMLDTTLPNRPQTYRQLACHVFQIAEAFLDLVEHGKRLEFAAYVQDVPPHVHGQDGLVAFGAGIEERFACWWEQTGRSADWRQKADVYYGEQTLHEFLERTAWHAAQHTRQLQMIVEKLGLPVDGPLTEADLRGLPVPEHVWDDKMAFN